MTSVVSPPCASPDDMPFPFSGIRQILDFPDSASRPEGGLLLRRKALLAMALQLAERAPSWPSMAKPVFQSPLIRRRWDVVQTSVDVEAWVIAWPPGGTMELHDHGGSVGAVVVSSGELTETRAAPNPGGSIDLWTRTLSVGRSIGFAEHDVHGLTNATETPAVSVHVYAPPPTSLRYHRPTQPAPHGQNACGCAWSGQIGRLDAELSRI
jgi:hypothetical protein